MGNKQKLNNTQEIIEKNIFSTIEWQENITVLDLSHREISNFDVNIILPPNLVDLNLAHNKFTEVPETVLKLDNLKLLDLSHNKIEYFDDTPNFCHTIESLDLLNNELKGPPYWVWAETPKKLKRLNLRDNHEICQSLVNYYLEELLQYIPLVNVIDLSNCCLGKHMKLMSTFRHAKVVNLGNKDYNYWSVNHIENVPCIGLEDCHTIEVLNLSNTHIYNVQHNIDIYTNLVEIDLSQNYINSLPNEFCNLENLQICILSFNKILYLPDNMCQLTKLTQLYLDNNELCMLPQRLHQLKYLKALDLYNNHLYESVEDFQHLEQYDFAQNYGDEPNDEAYWKKKKKLRLNFTDRLNGRAPEVVHEESEQSEREHDDFDYYDEDNIQQEQQEAANNRSSSPEDWDSDDHWIPSHVDISNETTQREYSANSTAPNTMQWLDYVKKKMEEGNFCPMDMHLSISITEKVKFENMYNPRPEYESDGQFDDFSDDDT